jgi:hypothetical protein
MMIVLLGYTNNLLNITDPLLEKFILDKKTQAALQQHAREEFKNLENIL